MTDQSERVSPSINVTVGSASHAGMIRSSNQDALLTLEVHLDGSIPKTYLGFFAVADGMGGHQGGEVASHLALRVLASEVAKILLLPSPEGTSSDSYHGILSQALISGIKAANAAVYADAETRGNNMGTTLVAALLVDNTAYVANVGDSRAYLLEGDQLRQITTDHSQVATLVASGEISPEEVYTHPNRNVITRCLGTQPDVEADLFVEMLKPDKALLLCSDGLWEMVKDPEIRDAILTTNDPQVACDKLVRLANNNGGVDNIASTLINLRD